ncbi:hypothetical protein GCM10023322_60130 [Rugosimonospora acidiphila]|uniref:Uncharacterized protein n=1 Tax=Rugosimonospora acidiphila TaxID=556531 RepID=A0ABP9SFA6_9ACTN
MTVGEPAQVRHVGTDVGEGVHAGFPSVEALNLWANPDGGTLGKKGAGSGLLDRRDRARGRQV